MSIIQQPSSGGSSGAPVTSLPIGGTISASGYYDNVGAVALTNFLLDSTSGLSVYVKRVATQEITIQPPAGKSINWSGGSMAVNEKLRLLADGDVVHLVVDASGNPQVTSEFGALAEETP